jgi:Protein of unknown function (DUF2924)
MMTDGSELEDEIARLRDLDLPTLRARWRSVFRRKAPEPLPRHLLFRILAYRLQAERLGDLDKETVRLLDRITSGNGGNGHSSVVGKQSRFDRLQPGSMLVREWDGARQRVVVLDRGFAWNGKTYRSLSAVAFAMTGTRWSGPRFFGLRGRMEGQS